MTVCLRAECHFYFTIKIVNLITLDCNNTFILLFLVLVSYQIKSVQELSGQICHICGDEIEIAEDGEPFVACNECAFPVCQQCYKYERLEGNQACPQCKTRYKRIKGNIVSILFSLIFIIYRQTLTNL